MTIEEFTKEKVLEDVAKLQYLYGLKKVIRYDQTRHEEDSTESVAEHVYGMHLLAQYFLPLENPEGTWSTARIYEMITLHDVDEIETGDILGWAKTPEQRLLEAEATKVVIQKSPLHMQTHLLQRLEEYEARETFEAKFARAIDKIEPLVQNLNAEGKVTFQGTKTTAEKSLRIKTPYVAKFPFVKKFSEIIHQELIDGGYYWKEGE